MQPSASSVSYFILWSTISILLQSAQSEPQVPCFFVFGDSLSDNGNNNNLQTLAKVNYPPYGIDFPGQIPTGRFSNGRTIVDVISEHLGFEEPSPPFASIYTMDQNIILKGVNYASGSAGIRSETGEHMGVRIPLDQQLVNHQTVVSKIDSILGSESSSFLNECLYMINMGSNDYLNNYFVPEHYSTSREYTPDQYAQVLVEQYSQQIQTLYGLGARKVALFSLGEVGFIPQSINKCGSLGIVCWTARTAASTLFNVELRKLVDKLNSKHTDAKFTCINMDVTFPLSTCPSVTRFGLLVALADILDFESNIYIMWATSIAYETPPNTLYGLGARKVALFSLGEVGFIPQSINKCGSLGIVCWTARTAASTLFNVELRKLVDKLNSKHTDAKFTCINMDVTFPLSTCPSVTRFGLLVALADILDFESNIYIMWATSIAYETPPNTLYGLGARKVALFSLGEVGFIPQSINKCGSLGIVCWTARTAASTLFNVELRKLVDKLNSKHTDAKFTCINMDVTFPLSTIISPALPRFADTCCKVKSTGMCEEGNDVCDNRNDYVFFDNYHPTEGINMGIGDRAYAESTPLDVYPIDIRTLVQTRLPKN